MRILIIFLISLLFLNGSSLVTAENKKFIPGDKILFQEDFSKCPIGEFPDSFDKSKLPVECVKYNNHIWIAPSSKNGFNIYKKLNLTNKEFSIEYDFIPYKKGEYPFRFRLLTKGKNEKEWDQEEWGMQDYDVVYNSYGKGAINMKIGDVYKFKHPTLKKKIHIAIALRRGQYRVFVNNKKITALSFTKKHIWGFSFWTHNLPKYGLLLSNIKIAEYSKKEEAPKPEKLGIEVTNIDNAVKLTLPEKVLFDFNKFILKDSAKEALNVVGDYIKYKGAKKIVVTGYTDNIGSDEYNLKLSLQRAQSVADYLIYCKNIDPNIIVIKGLGKANPIASNATKEGQAKNRRVEIKLLGEQNE